MSLEIIGTESLGVRGLCCAVALPKQYILIDPGISLGYCRHGLLPHPLQVAVGCGVRNKICEVINHATDVVFSHFHGDHVPLLDANPYQLSIQALPRRFRELRCWSKSDTGPSTDAHKRFRDLADLLGENMQVAEGRLEGPLCFSTAVPHGSRDSNRGTVMMTRIEMDRHNTFVHASDIQLLDDATVERIIDWQPSILIAAGPPLYLGRLSRSDQDCAWANAVRLAQKIDVLILDHHLMRGPEGPVWLDELSATAGRRVYCAADFMGRPRLPLEANRRHLYEQMPVPDTWHDNYAKDHLGLEAYAIPLHFPVCG